LAVDDALAAEFSSYATRSVEEAHDAIAAHYYDMRLEVDGPDEEFGIVLDVADLGSITVGEVRFGTPVRMNFSEPGYYHVVVPAVGGFRIREGGDEPVCASPTRACLFDPARGIAIDRWTPDCRTLTVKVEKAALHRQLEHLLDRPLPRPPRFGPTFDCTFGAGRSWARLVRWSLMEKEIDQGLLRTPLIRGRFEQTLLDGLLLACEHTYRDELAAPAPPMRPAAVKRVMDAVCARPADRYDAARLAEIAQVSVRTLQEAFRKHVGMPPMAYVNEVRLERVREQLRAADPGSTTVSDVAYRWGFGHLGRFARRYRERFGEAPSQTLRTA
jgi:AraC-like DNA-binding protein